VYGIFERLGEDHFHPTVGSSVSAYLRRYPEVEWQDWEDEPVPPEADGPADPDVPAVQDLEPGWPHGDEGAAR
jgi:hypothetical protein